jgi:RNA polymerase sigma-70 factor, ECF subfamily
VNARLADEPPSDLDLARRAQSGDRAALDALIRRMTPRIAHQLARFAMSPADRDDAVQNALVQIVERISQFRGDAQLSTWLYRVTANEGLMLLRSNRRRAARWTQGMDLDELAELQATSEDDRPLEAALFDARRDAHVREAIARLPPSYRQVLVAHYHEGLGLREIARRSGSSMEAVRSRLHRARAGLRGELDCCTPVTPNDLAA